jgi:hypothetical protein
MLSLLHRDGPKVRTSTSRCPTLLADLAVIRGQGCQQLVFLGRLNVSTHRLFERILRCKYTAESMSD